MNRSYQVCRLTGLSVIAASAAIAQGLPPEVVLLARIKSHLRDELSRAPNYTCLETVSRFRRVPGTDGTHRAQLRPTDTVRLEIVYSNHREYYGSPGDREMSVDNPRAFIGSGMIGNGLFALTLNNILEGAQFIYRGDELLSGHPIVRYDFRIPRMLKGLSVSIPGGRGEVGEEGSIRVNKTSLDLVRIEAVASEIPPWLPLQEMHTDVTYARTRIGEHEVLLAQQADIDVLEPTGLEDFDRFAFTHCRAYAAESEVHFDTGSSEPPRRPLPATPSGSMAPGDESESLPALLPVTVQLATSVSDQDSVGKLIQGKVSGDVTRKAKILIPDGSRVRGRIRRLERYDERKTFAVGLEFTEIEVRGRRLPFYADLLRIDKNPAITPTLSERVFVPHPDGIQTEDERVTLRELPGVASFFVTGKGFTIPAGFRMVWRTRGVIR